MVVYSVLHTCVHWVMIFLAIFKFVNCDFYILKYCRRPCWIEKIELSSACWVQPEYRCTKFRCKSFNRCGEIAIVKSLNRNFWTLKYGCSPAWILKKNKVFECRWHSESMWALSCKNFDVFNTRATLASACISCRHVSVCPSVTGRCSTETCWEWPAKTPRTRMWATAQRDGRPAEYRWRPLFNAAKFG